MTHETIPSPICKPNEFAIPTPPDPLQPAYSPPSLLSSASCQTPLKEPGFGAVSKQDCKRAHDPSNKTYGEYSNQEPVFDGSLNVADGPDALNYTVWTYCPDNSHMWGDRWNMEDLSLWFLLTVTIRVTPADASQSDRKDDEVVSSSIKTQGEESSLPTGILLPLVHSASDECVRQSLVRLSERKQ
ncbi:hypothetical protein BU15DRAFT_63499 [Melanogaster broomeanus]|nr:hypothetical protein BU15DRAFT_63499 [Melanogaster broomeanus]